MKKITFITVLMIVSFFSMNFRGCSSVSNLILLLNAMSSGDYRYADNLTWYEYTIYAGNNGKIYRSSGENNLVFTEMSTPTTQQLNNVRVSPHDSFDDAVAVGNNGTVIYSFNAGETWALSSQVTSSNLYGIDFIFGNTFAVGDAGTILMAPYPGGTWSVQQSGTNRNLKAVKVSAQQTGTAIAVGEKGTILRTTNGGTNWINAGINDTTFNFYDISQKGIYFSGDINCAVGSGGRIYKSTDNGTTWIQKPSGTTNNLRKVYFNSPDSGVVVGDNGTLRLTTNGGETWFTDSFFPQVAGRNYKSAGIINNNHNTFAALSDTLFFVSSDPLTVGLEQTGSAIPEKFSLSQNYPNPFNPSTSIRISIPNSSLAELKIYDIAGREVETLVNGKLSAGEYNYNWNAANLPSGIYFYTLRTEIFTETKKMILIK